MSKKRAKQPVKAGPPVLTFKDTAQVLAWVEYHVKPYDADSGDTLPQWTHTDLCKAVLWWHANEQAEGWGDLRQKDVASMLLAGMPPLTLAGLQETLDSAHESEDESLTAAQDIEANLRAFFQSRLAR